MSGMAGGAVHVRVVRRAVRRVHGCVPYGVGLGVLMKIKASPLTLYDPKRDGVTFSLLTAFKNCREKTKNILEGWTSDKTTMAVTFGNMTHELLRRTYRDHKNGVFTGKPPRRYIAQQIDDLEALWRQENPRADTEDLEHLEMTILLMQAVMPLYFQHWTYDFRLRWDRLESEFRVPVSVKAFINRFGEPKHWPGGPYPSFKRGKMDGSYRGTSDRLRLFETKTRGRIDGDTTSQILPFEMQVNIYMGALVALDREYPSGVLYNIIRRPQLRLKKKETLAQFADRVVADIRARPDWYFVRLQMNVSKKEVNAAMRDIEGVMADFLAWWNGDAPHYRNSDHCEGKYGTCPFLKKCSSNDTTGLYVREKVFRELDEM